MTKEMFAVAILTTLTVPLGVEMGWDEDVTMFVAMFVFFLGLALCFISLGKNISKYSEYVVYTPEDYKIYLKKRSPIIASRFQINASHNSYLKHTPAKITYTGATVGGITTGGFHTTEAYDTLMLGEKNGLYFLTIKLADNKHQLVSTIFLTGKLLEEAQKSSINKYLSGGFINVSQISKECANEIITWIRGE